MHVVCCEEGVRLLGVEGRPGGMRDSAKGGGETEGLSGGVKWLQAHGVIPGVRGGPGEMMMGSRVDECSLGHHQELYPKG